MIKRIFFFSILLFTKVYAQSPLTKYTVSATFSQECIAFISLELFDKSYKLDSLNQLIINETIKYHYGVNNPGLIPMRFYNNTKYGSDAPINRNIENICTFRNKGFYSFIACPINACSEEIYSNYESVCFTIDSAKGKVITIDQVIAPEKRDSFDKFVFMVTKRYNIRNLPTGYYFANEPLDIRTSNGMMNPVNKFELEMGVQSRFHIKGSHMVVYNNASNTDYPYKSVEVALPLNLVNYFLKPAYAKVFIPE